MFASGLWFLGSHGIAAKETGANRLFGQWMEDLQLVEKAASEGTETWDVFVSHPGHLKDSIVASVKDLFGREHPTVRVFVDAWELKPGDDAPAKMMRACGTAPVGVVVVSRASIAAEWPMRELHILLHRHRDSAVKLLPLLHFDDFREFERCVEDYEGCRCSGHGCRCHKRLWAEDLRRLQAVTMIRKDMQRDPELAQAVVASVVGHLREMGGLRDPGQRPLAVGRDEQVWGLVEVIRGGKWVWLHGTGGVGKSTLAEALQHDLLAAGAATRSAVLRLEFTAGQEVSLSEQRTLDLLNGAIAELTGSRCTERGNIRSAFRAAANRAGVLLVVDNVHSEEQVGLLLKDILGPTGGTEAAVIFTSRSEQPLGGGEHTGVWLQVRKRLEWHRVDSLPFGFALQLFQQDWGRPESVSEAVEKHVVKSCSGLPLALLLVKGALASCTDGVEWMKAAHALQSGDLDPHEAVYAVSESRLHATMQYSLHGLPEAAVGMFLDAACVLHGRDERDALLVWRQWHGDRAGPCLKLLKMRNTLTSDAEGRLQVHDVLRWFARRVVLGKGKASADQATLHGSRLWVQDGKIAGGVPQGRVLAARLEEDYDGTWFGNYGTMDAPLPLIAPAMSTADLSHARVLLAGCTRVDVQGTKLLWLEVRDRPCPDLTRIMSNKGICILRLVEIDGLTALPDELGQLSALQELNLVGCSGLSALPEGVGRLSALQKLDLRECSGLTALPEGVGQLSVLQTLDLRGCSGLATLPEGVGQLSALQTLYLQGCSGLTTLPEGVGQLSALQTLNLVGCSGLSALPDGVGKLSALQTLNLRRCSGLTALPERVGQLSALQTLYLAGCSGLIALPEGVGRLSALQTLNLVGCNGLTVLQEEVGQLTALQGLYLVGCSGLTALPEGVGRLSALQTLNLMECTGLTVLPEAVGQLSALHTLHLEGCTGLTELPEGMGQLETRGLRVFR